MAEFETLRGSFRRAKYIAKGGDLIGALRFMLVSLGRSKRPVKLTLDSRRLMLRPRTPDFDVAIACFKGEFVPAIEAAGALKYRFIVDAGGYIGAAAIAFAEAFPDARIVTLEPAVDNFGVLQKNVASFPNIVALNKALGPNRETMALIDRGTGEWGYSLVAQPADCSTPMWAHEVDVVTVPDLLSQFGVDGIDILKLDIEGGERDLFAERFRWIDAVQVIIAELHDRIAPGSTASFVSATNGRLAATTDGEKVISVRGS